MTAPRGVKASPGSGEHGVEPLRAAPRPAAVLGFGLTARRPTLAEIRTALAPYRVAGVELEAYTCPSTCGGTLRIQGGQLTGCHTEDLERSITTTAERGAL